ncbi:BlaI/MecI/CopY family transcriptional regulator [Streptomyces tropicalis]|uniref:BlaI/MecI/CopY family transcriptional regulator n=1 Tax=Streptomyces tropicalis TaxID=3034234 RepID=A0ABT6A2N2_9ACTN|nr:BlaI/MecI/CopY family transcriptional regulator [Streptomyces tropicalis]MDF3298904.1 BlaI/MecI/CopY family transcriptional regulator [Streptomyces tropicalis]
MNTGPIPAERRPGGALEAEVLALLQSSRRPLTPGDVLQHLSDDLAYSTVVTVLSRMFEKGLLTREKQGRAYAYTPVTDTHGFAARRMRQALESDPDREAVLTHFVEDLSTSDEQLLRQLLGGLPDQG